jgi:hypothetical protein
VFRYDKVKTNGTKGRLEEKIIAVLFVLTAFTFFVLTDLTSSDRFHSLFGSCVKIYL